jgi:hypothetical protein
MQIIAMSGGSRLRHSFTYFPKQVSVFLGFTTLLSMGGGGRMMEGESKIH